MDLCVSDCELACSMMTLWGKESLGESSRFHEGMLNSFVYIDSSTVGIATMVLILKQTVTRLLVKQTIHTWNQ